MAINSRADLDALIGTPEYNAFMQTLAGTLWRLERNDDLQSWVAVEDNSTIARFGFTRADFPDAQPPELPEYVPNVDPVPSAVSMRQARLALLNAGLLAQVETAIASLQGMEGDAARIEWEYAQEVRRDSALVTTLAAALGLDDAALDTLFIAGAAL